MTVHQHRSPGAVNHRVCFSGPWMTESRCGRGQAADTCGEQGQRTTGSLRGSPRGTDPSLTASSPPTGHTCSHQQRGLGFHVDGVWGCKRSDHSWWLRGCPASCGATCRKNPFCSHHVSPPPGRPYWTPGKHAEQNTFGLTHASLHISLHGAASRGLAQSVVVLMTRCLLWARPWRASPVSTHLNPQ